jgi:hypothetical protein
MFEMKISRKQLRRIISEAMPAGGVPDVVGAVTGVFGEATRQLDHLSGKSLVLKSFIGVMKRAHPGDLDDLAKLWSGMVAKPGDIAAARELGMALGLKAAVAIFHARKIDANEEYPAGAELQDLVLAWHEETKNKRASASTKQPVRKPYGGGSRQRPWDRST